MSKYDTMSDIFCCLDILGNLYKYKQANKLPLGEETRQLPMSQQPYEGVGVGFPQTKHLRVAKWPISLPAAKRPVTNHFWKSVISRREKRTLGPGPR